MHRLALAVLLIIAIDQLAPGVLPWLIYSGGAVLGEPAFWFGLIGSSLAAGFWMSLGRTGLAREQYHSAIDKAEKDYRENKGWL